ncbi:hypothetical protein [Longirhabdus pacifica]|uniref:hypothetical protein n=1 Tax=Longirhabdus pacifica TaxID=2305227 RepID=UPI0013E89D9A|nr:hypothetical protein [Longirhabdus pacifica]
MHYRCQLFFQILLVAQLGAMLFFGYEITEQLQTEIVAFAEALLIILSLIGDFVQFN